MVNGQIRRRSEQFRMQIPPALFGRLVFFDLNAIRIGVGVLPDPSDLPGDLNVWLVRQSAE
jgi:hypothetical protein